MIKLFKVAEDKDYEDIPDNTELWGEPVEEIGQIALDILETKHEIILLAPVAWIELEDIDLLFNNGVLTIRWTRKKPDIYSSGAILRNSECFWWEFKRNVILPENLDFEAIKASLENNLLSVVIPKLKFSSQSIRIEQKI
jgi:HSP20 family molecular chaperone IbpA